MEQERGIDASELTGEALARELKGIFDETKEMILEAAEKWGIDPTPMSDEEYAEIRDREDNFVDGDELSQLGNSYWRSAMEILDGDSFSNQKSDDEVLRENLAVLWQFVFFIPVNLKSSIHALLDDEGYEDLRQAEDSQSYANGSAKSALIAIDRSILAWTNLVTHDAARIRAMIELLETIRTKLEARFPLARDFIRPGFDEIEVMCDEVEVLM